MSESGQSSQDANKLKVYYNSACPVCKAGIESQKGKSSQCEIQWQDVHQDESLVQEVNAELEFVRERLHVVDADGRLQVGFEAFLTIWRNSPRETWKAKLFSLPGLRQFGNFAYKLFARLLYRWNRAKKHW